MNCERHKNNNISSGFLIDCRAITLVLFSTLDDVAGHERGGVVVALQRARGQVPLDLQPEEVSRVLLLDLRRRVRRVELDAEAEEGVTRGEAHLVVHLLVQVQPILKGKEDECFV